VGKKRKAQTATVDQFPRRDLEQITDAMIAWQETGWTRDPLALPAVYASVRLIASTINQLPVEVTNGEPPEWLLQPRRYGSAFDLNDLTQYIVVAMALRGAAYLRCERTGDSWAIDALHNDSVQTQTSTSGIVRLKFLVDGQEMEPIPSLRAAWSYGGPFILHIPYLVTVDHPEGLSPVTAARLAIDGYQAVERQASTLLDNGTYSGGRLETDQDITTATANYYQDTWIANRKVGKLPVLGTGLKYVNDLINPTDAQWLESRQYNNGQVAMMFGIPPDYLGMAMSGGSSSLSYANSQDNDRRFRRNCLAAFTQQISDAFSLLLPPGRSESENQRLVFDYTQWEGEDAPSSGGGPMVDQSQPGRDADDRGPGGPVGHGNHIWRHAGIVRPGSVQPGAGDGVSPAVVPRSAGADRPRDSGVEHSGGIADSGDRAADEPGTRRDNALIWRFFVGPLRRLRPDRKETGEGRGEIPERPPARIISYPAARISAGSGDSNPGTGGRDAG
jgi:HK97 family phage portal protein